MFEPKFEEHDVRSFALLIGCIRRVFTRGNFTRHERYLGLSDPNGARAIGIRSFVCLSAHCELECGQSKASTEEDTKCLGGALQGLQVSFRVRGDP